MEPLKRDHIYAELECRLTGLNLMAGENVTIPVLVRNISRETFDSDPPNGIYVSYQWFTENRKIIYPDSVFSTPLPTQILPGESRRVMARMKAPGINGTYLLKVILVQIKGFVIAETKISKIMITQNQQREYANLFENAIKKGNLTDALKYYKKDRNYFGVEDDSENVFICRVMGTKEWCNAHSLPYKIYAKAEPILISPPYRPGKSKPLHSEGILIFPELYVAELHNASIIGGQEPVLVDNNIAIIDNPPEKDTDPIFLEDGIVSIEFRGLTIIRLWNKNNEKSIPIIEKGILFCGWHASNYFHWMVDFLSRIWIINQCPEFNEFPFIVDRSVPEKFLDALKAIDTRHRDIIRVEYGVRYRVKDLVLPAKVTQYSPETCGTYKESSISPIAIKFLREKFGTERKIPVKSPQKWLYIQRINPLYRNLLNEKEIEELFERYGFEFIDCSRLSISEQIEAFSLADIIAGPHGAGWTNMIFAPSDVQGLMLLGPQPNYIYSNIVHIIGQDLIHVHGECITIEPPLDKNQCDYAVNVENVEFALDALIGRYARSHVHEILVQNPKSIRLNIQHLPEIPGLTEYSVDQINRKDISDEPITIDRGSDRQILIEGWAIDSSPRNPADAVFITFDSGQEYRAYYSICRPDVAAHFSDEKLGYTGFASVIPLDDLPAGTRSFRIKIVSHDRGGYYCPPERFFILIDYQGKTDT